MNKVKTVALFGVLGGLFGIVSLALIFLINHYSGFKVPAVLVDVLFSPTKATYEFLAEQGILASKTTVITGKERSIVIFVGYFIYVVSYFFIGLTIGAFASVFSSKPMEASETIELGG